MVVCKSLQRRRLDFRVFGVRLSQSVKREARWSKGPRREAPGPRFVHGPASAKRRVGPWAVGCPPRHGPHELEAFSLRVGDVDIQIIKNLHLFNFSKEAVSVEIRAAPRMGGRGGIKMHQNIKKIGSLPEYMQTEDDQPLTSASGAEGGEFFMARVSDKRSGTLADTLPIRVG